MGTDRLANGQNGAAAMRRAATGLLVLMAAIYGVARYFEGAHPAVGFVRAFAEAGMVGGMADWFAVTALFRHPLGLPIPHTAIIPRNKDRIGDTLAVFLRDNFLTASVVARRMRRIDVAGALGRFLAAPPRTGRMREGASRLAATILESLDDQRLGGMAKAMIASRLRGLDLSPMLGQSLDAAIARDRHLPIIDGIIGWAGRTLAANEALIRAMVNDKAGSILRWTGLDEKLANAILDGLHKLIADMASDRAHPLRAKAEEGLVNLAWDLQRDPAMRARVEGFKEEMIDNPAVTRWIDGIWEQARAALLQAVRDPQAALAGRLGDALRQFGETLQNDPKLARSINQFTRRATVGAVARYGDGIVKLVSETIRGWDARTITGRLEQAVGRDLQYIRINGTLVGGLVGTLIHLVDTIG
ncbi:DUF445 domain-containing protein [Sphingomonas sp. 1P06PA]|uniref:DUF445 domain-containing protein n=1 Tax=Sphingomonas sp. 1P06PA TaxID=554121 RepID=UPI0039A546E8